jgi:hypothetical protein
MYLKLNMAHPDEVKKGEELQTEDVTVSLPKNIAPPTTAAPEGAEQQIVTNTKELRILAKTLGQILAQQSGVQKLRMASLVNASKPSTDRRKDQLISQLATVHENALMFQSELEKMFAQDIASMNRVKVLVQSLPVTAGVPLGDTDNILRAIIAILKANGRV